MNVGFNVLPPDVFLEEDTNIEVNESPCSQQTHHRSKNGQCKCGQEGHTKQSDTSNYSLTFLNLSIVSKKIQEGQCQTSSMNFDHVLTENFTSTIH